MGVGSMEEARRQCGVRVGGPQGLRIQLLLLSTFTSFTVTQCLDSSGAAIHPSIHPSPVTHPSVLAHAGCWVFREGKVKEPLGGKGE